MTLDVMYSWIRQLSSVPDLSAYLTIATAVLIVLWLTSLIAARRERRRMAAQIRDLEQRVVMIEARRERDLLKNVRTPPSETEPTELPRASIVGVSNLRSTGQ